MSNSPKDSKITLTINDLQRLLEKAFVAGYESPEELMKEEVERILHSAQCTVESFGSVVNSKRSPDKPEDRVFAMFDPSTHTDAWRRFQKMIGPDSESKVDATCETCEDAYKNDYKDEDEYYHWSNTIY